MKLHKLYVLISLIFFLACGQKAKDKKSILIDSDTNTLIQPKELTGSSIAFEICCWCFFNKAAEKDEKGRTVITTTACTTPWKLNPIDIISFQNLLDSSSNQDRIKQISGILWSGKKSDAKNISIEARFLILLRKHNETPDTFLFNGYNEFILNNKYLLEYKFNFMDSLREILGRNEINCK